MDNNEDLKGKIVDGFIQSFSVSPFCVALYCNRQLDILSRFTKLSEGSVLHLDSTGTVSARLPAEYGIKRQFYYALCIRLTDAIEAPVVPVFEFISNSQMATTIADILHSFFQV
jgi:hypothetical protein